MHHLLCSTTACALLRSRPKPRRNRRRQNICAAQSHTASWQKRSFTEVGGPNVAACAGIGLSAVFSPSPASRRPGGDEQNAAEIDRSRPFPGRVTPRWRSPTRSRVPWRLAHPRGTKTAARVQLRPGLPLSEDLLTTVPGRFENPASVAPPVAAPQPSSEWFLATDEEYRRDRPVQPRHHQ